MKVINVVLTGGVGSRLWPLSRKKNPKQYLDIFEGQSLFQQTVLRNSSLCEQLMVVGNIDNSALSQKVLSAIGVANYIELVEATPRNTAAAIAFAAFAAEADDILLVTPSDHMIEVGVAYETALKQAVGFAKDGAIVTFGLKPDKPETGYGYIHIKGDKVVGFREKPNVETAQEYLKSGEYYWNSGMFCFKANVFLEELATYEPEVYQQAKNAFEQKEGGKLPLDASVKIPSISVDYAVMERTKKLKAVVGEFAWSDMGSFESVYDYLFEKGQFVDSNGNMVIGTNSHIEFLGLKKCILVYTDDAILVLKKDKAQDVKKVYEGLINTELI